MRDWIYAAGGLLMLTVGGTANSQIWIGQIVGNMVAQGQAEREEHACMMGGAMPAVEVDETRSQTAAIMTTYAAAFTGSGTADVRSAWHQDDYKAQWKYANTRLRPNQLGAVNDPFMRAGARIDPSPVAYLRSGDGKVVEGLWPARSSAGAVLGVYHAVFARVGGIWKLRSLNLLDPAGAPTGLVQYCHKPGDVQPYKVAYEERQRKIEAKRAAKAAAKAAREAERARQGTAD